jgi:hypothetical protein
MVNHHFLFQPGIWYAEGKVKVVSLDKELKFYAKWIIEEKKSEKILARQLVELDEGKEKIVNQFLFFDLSGVNFNVALTNEQYGRVVGKGIIGADAIAWEFHGKEMPFEGFEIYQLFENEQYKVRSEFSSEGEPHTIINSNLWKKGN